MRVLRMAAAAALALTLACGSGSTTGPSQTLTNGTFTARVDGASFNASFAVVAVAGSIISIGASNAAGQSLGFAWVDAGAATYPISQTAPTNGSYSFGASGWGAGVAGGSGSITITSRTANRVVGTFSFVMVATPNTSATGTKNVTQGSFDLTF